MVPPLIPSLWFGKCLPKVHVWKAGPQPVALLGSSGAFKGWSLMGGRDVIGGVALRGYWDLSSSSSTLFVLLPP